ncbi:MAG: hypothetical protein KDD49_00875, partial [Bacteroidetes bacterium]|nr:hypothetical protein [Bacteroidota bacterium]
VQLSAPLRLGVIIKTKSTQSRRENSNNLYRNFFRVQLSAPLRLGVIIKTKSTQSRRVIIYAQFFLNAYFVLHLP